MSTKEQKDHSEGPEKDHEIVVGQDKPTEFTPEQEAEQVQQLVEEVNRLMQELDSNFTSEVNRILLETEGELDQATRQEIEDLLAESLRAKEEIESSIKDRARALNLQFNHEFEEVNSKKIMSEVLESADLTKLEKLLGTGDKEDFIKAYHFYSGLVPYGERKKLWDESVKDKFNVLALSDLDEAVQLYQQLPYNFKGSDEARRAMWLGFAAKYADDMTEGQKKEIIKQQFQGCPDILAEQAIRSLDSWSPNEIYIIIKDLYQKERDAKNAVGFAEEYSDGFLEKFDLRDVPEDKREEIRPILFQAYASRRPEKIFEDLDTYQDLVIAMSDREKTRFISNCIYAKNIPLYENLDKLQLELRPWQASELLSLYIVSPETALTAISPERLQKLGLNKEEAIRVLANRADRWLGSYPKEGMAKFSLEDEQAIARAMIQSYPRNLLQYIDHLDAGLTPEELTSVIEQCLIDSPFVVLSQYAVGVIELTMDQKQTLIQNFYKTGYASFLLEALSTLKLTKDEESIWLHKLATKHPDSVIAYSMSEGFLIPRDVLTQAINNQADRDAMWFFEAISIKNLNFSETELKRIVQSAYKQVLADGGKSLSDIAVIRKETGMPMEYNETNQHLLLVRLRRERPSNYHQALSVYNELIPNQTDDVIIPWERAYNDLLKLQGRSERVEYDAWRTDLDPLVATAAEQGFLSPDKVEDGAILVSFVKEYGMYNIPTILKWHTAMERVADVKDLPEEIKRDIESSLKIDLDKIPNKGSLVAEIREFRQRIQSELLQDHTPQEILYTQAGRELFLSLLGSTQWTRYDDPVELIRVWQDNPAKNPELAEMPEGYRETSFAVPLAMRRQLTGTEEEKLQKRESELLDNEELQKSLGRLQESYEFAADMENLPLWWQKQRQTMLGLMQAEMEVIRGRMGQAPNDKARQGMGKQMEKWQKLMNAFAETEAPDISGMDNTDAEAALVGFMESLVGAAYASSPDADKKPEELLRVIGFNELLRNISALHSTKVMGVGRTGVVANAIRATKERRGADALNEWRNHLTDYIGEHYLHSDIANHDITGHEPFSPKLLKELQTLWGTANGLDKNLIVQKQKELELMREQGAEKSTKTMEVSMIPVRGVLKVFSGDVGNACYTSKHQELAEGKYPEITPYVFVTGRGTKDERIRGSVLMIETKSEEGEPVLLVRANNPQENLLQQLDAESLIEGILQEARQLADRRGIKTVVVPRDGASQSSSNRPQVAEYYQQYATGKRIGLKRADENQFNGYDNADADGPHAVVSIT